MPGRNQEDSPGTSTLDDSAASLDAGQEQADMTLNSGEASGGTESALDSNRTSGLAVETGSDAQVPGTPTHSKLSNGNLSTNGISESEESIVSPDATASASPPPQHPPAETTQTPQRPRRAAATAANERMVLRKRSAQKVTPGDNTISSSSTSPAKTKTPASSPPRKRRARGPDTTVTSADTAEVTHSPLMSLLKSRQRKAAAAPVPASNRKKPRVEEEDVQIRNLFGYLRTGEMTIGGLVDSWVDAYKRDHLTGFLELANFFVHSAGCKGRITAGMTRMAAEQIINQLTQKFDEDTNDYPLIRTDKEYKKFRTDFCKFLHTMVLAIKDTILFDDYLMDNVLRLLAEMADSSVRAFRHTATLGVLKILTGLVEVMLQHDRVVKTDQQQLEQEENRKRANQQRIQMLQRTLNVHKEQADKVKNYFELACKQVFFIRYRDVVTVIREMCMEEIGIWMFTYPERFVDDSYLKYLGWSLNDKESTVRRKCLSSIYPLYEIEENVLRLQLFSSKFKDRFVQMATDVDTECCIRAGKILIAMNKSMPELFGDTDLTRIFDLIYVADHNLAVSSAEILYNHMTTVTAVDRQNPRRFKSGKEWSDEMWDLYALVQFSVTVASKTTNQAYFVDSLIDVCPAIKAWEAMTDLLLEEPDETLALTDDEEKALIIIMSWAIKQTATGEAPGGRSHPGRKRSKDAKQMKDEISEFTAHFIDVLPKLFSKYKQDPVKVVFLISIPQYFDVDLYTTNHKEAELNALLDLLSEVYEKYDNTALLKAAVKSLDCLEREGSGIVNRVAITRTTILGSIVSKFQEAFPHWLAFNGENDQELVYHMESSIKRLYALLLTSDGSELDIWESMLQTLERALSLNQNSISESSIKCCMLLLIWKVKAYKKSLEEPEISVLEEHKKRAENFLDVVLRVVADQEQSEEVLHTAFFSAIDTVIAHCQQEGSQAWSSTLFVQFSPEQQSTLASFVSTLVLSKPLTDGNSSAAFNSMIGAKEREQHNEVLYKRRVLLFQFVKAMLCAAVLPRYASVVFKNAVASNADYGDIIKEAMKRLQEINPVYFAESIGATLVELFTDIVKKRRITRNSRDILEVKDMAKRFAVYFGTDNNRSRSAMGALHKYCLEFIKAASSNDDITQRISFFDILSEFHTKLLREDKISLVNFMGAMDLLGRNLPNDSLLPFLQYRNLLSMSGIQGEPEDKHRRGRRVNPAAPKNTVGREAVVIAEADSSEAGEGTNMSEVTNGGPDDVASVAGSVGPEESRLTVDIENSMDVS